MDNNIIIIKIQDELYCIACVLAALSEYPHDAQMAQAIGYIGDRIDRCADQLLNALREAHHE
ncbi:MAG: hypothetical protein IJ751_03605 [Oscillospiraceae bacterium]|nr:hypothetical protein [Oscillospiraceae bacterium]